MVARGLNITTYNTDNGMAEVTKNSIKNPSLKGRLILTYDF